MSDPDLSQPDSPLAEILDAAIELIEGRCEQEGIAPPRGLIIIHADSVPGSEKDSTVAGFGYEDARDLVPDLAQHLIAAGRAFGLQVQVHRLHGGPLS